MTDPTLLKQRAPALVELLRDRLARLGETTGQCIERWREERCEAADLISSLLADMEALKGERDEAIKLVTQYAREAGEATGRLEMSEAAGIVDGWRERAQAAEARATALEERVRELEGASVANSAASACGLTASETQRKSVGGK
jgi:uncharacterized coiled-coil DUF342 family protein